MKQITPEDLSARSVELLRAAQGEAVLVVRNGKPSALILGLEQYENYDVEDWDYMTDPVFWKMIRERRRETKTIPLHEVMARVAADEDKERQRLQPLAEKKA